MSFQVYIEPELQEKLDALCKKMGQKRNTLVREALREYLGRRLEKSWPDAVFQFKPDRALPRFEERRDELFPDRDNIFADVKL